VPDPVDHDRSDLEDAEDDEWDEEETRTTRRGMPEPDEDLWIDSNSCLTERTWLGGQEVVVHYDDIPAKDITVQKGIRCTTPLRTVIDIAPDVDPAELERIVRDCLDRGLFTVEEARARVAEPDMRKRPGAELLRRALPC
jgi:hypothetical protein